VSNDVAGNWQTMHSLPPEIGSLTLSSENLISLSIAGVMTTASITLNSNSYVATNLVVTAMNDTSNWLLEKPYSLPQVTQA
jgi:hypothetical protein